MKINDNYLKEQLQHVYWLNGGCCAGKITMTKKFIEELGFQILSDDVLKYRPFSSPVEYPTLQYPHPNLDWEKWFNRPTDVKYQWLCQIVVEMMEFFVVDLLKMPTDKPIIIDLGIMPEHILPFIPKERMICLYTSDEELYISDVVSSVTRLQKELKGFCKVTLLPGEAKLVTFTITKEHLQLMSREFRPVVEEGEFSIMVGRNSEDYMSTSLYVHNGADI
jgi:hypothetical protein